MSDATLSPLVRKKLSDHAQDALSRYIDEMLKAGQTKLPSEVELGQTLSVSRTTIRRALSDLEHKGVILRLHGKGTFINPDLSQITLSFSAGKPLLQIIRDSGFVPSVQFLYSCVCEASPLQRKLLSLEEDEPLKTICKVYYADGIPMLLVVDDVPQRFIQEGLSDEALCDSTFSLVLQHSGIACVRDELTLSTANSSAIMAYSMGKDILHCDSALVLDIVNFSEIGRPVFLSKQLFNTNYIKFHASRLLDMYQTN